LSPSGRGEIGSSVPANIVLAPMMSAIAPTKTFEPLVLIPFVIKLIPLCCELSDVWQNLLGMEIRLDEIEKSGGKSQYFLYGFCDNYVTRRPLQKRRKRQSRLTRESRQ
jgi:hypothetical protein